MRNLKYAILGLVNREPMTGYDIQKPINVSAGNTSGIIWSAGKSRRMPERIDKLFLLY